MGKDNEGVSLGEEVLLGKSLPQILGFLDLTDILTILVWVNKWAHSKVKDENYVFFKKFIWMLNIPSSFESSDLAIRENIFDVLKWSLALIKKNELKEINPFAFYTDGGSYSNDGKYFIHCIW